MPHEGPGASVRDLLAELVATRNLTAELRRRVEARDLQLERIQQELRLARAVRDFADLMTRPRVLLGLIRRCMLGRTDDVNRSIEIMLRQSDIPPSLDTLAVWATTPRTIFGLTRRWAFGGRLSAKGLIVLTLERDFDVSHDLARTHADH